MGGNRGMLGYPRRHLGGLLHPDLSRLRFGRPPAKRLYFDNNARSFLIIEKCAVHPCLIDLLALTIANHELATLGPPLAPQALIVYREGFEE